jgi:hypothetical protein
MQLYSSRGILLLALSVLTIAVLGAVFGLSAYRNSRIAVTDKHVIGGHATPSIASRGLRLTKVEKIEVRQSMMGKLLRFGTVVVYSTDGSRLRFGGVAAPFAFQKAIEQRQMALLQSTSRVPNRSD